MMAWRLALDMGTNSLGWARILLDGNNGVIGLDDGGVRIFSDARDAQTKESNAAQRRAPRGARKNRDRQLKRKGEFIQALIENGLMPEDEAARKALEGGKNIPQSEHDPWILRARALDEKISPHQFGRALFHLVQRRGFKSNRKTDKADNERGKMKDAIKRTREALQLANARTLGELYGRERLRVYEENQKTAKGNRIAQPVARVKKSGEGAKEQYDYYPTRELILDEFKQLWQVQQKFYPELLHDEAKDKLFDILQFQRPLKPQPVGKCLYCEGETRIHKAMPSFQKFRIFQEINNLLIQPIGQVSRALTSEQRDILLDKLSHPGNKQAKLTFDSMRKLLKLSEMERFNLEGQKRKFLDGDKVAALMHQKELWGSVWHDFSTSEQDEIITQLLEQQSEENLCQWLAKTYDLAPENCEKIANANLPEGTGNLSLKAIQKLMPFMENEALHYDEAVKKAFDSSHSNFSTGELLDELPYYGKVLERSVAFGTGDPAHIEEKRIGKIANPTVHVALNQLRKVVNDLIRRYGLPEQIVVEVARDLPLSAIGKKELENEQKENQTANEKRAKWLEENDHRNNRDNRMRLRLYEELPTPKCCVFTGECISQAMLFSDEVELEHLLPRSKTFDDSIANLVLCKRRANQFKGNRSPYEAFGHSPEDYDWEAIAARAKDLPKNKQWRFSEDAMQRFEDEEKFHDRHLNNTRYIARITKQYLEKLYGGEPIKGVSSHIWVVTGKLTSELRHHWGLDSILRGHNQHIDKDDKGAELLKKNRNDHRHHAIDAVVIGMIDRGLVQRASRIARQNEDKSQHLFKELPAPFEGFRDRVRAVVENITVSHKPDHGYQAQMMNETAYGISDWDELGEDFSKKRKVVTRKKLDGDFTSPKDLERIRDHDIKLALLEATQGLEKAEFKQALIQAGLAMKPQVRRVRVEYDYKVIPIQNRKTGKIYKAYQGDSNYCYDIWVNDKGKWVGEIISTFQAYQLAKKTPEWWESNRGRNGQPLIMRLRKNDMLQLEHDGREMIVRVVKMSAGNITMTEHFEANVGARTCDKNDMLKFIFKAPSSLQTSRAKRVTISASGEVRVYN